MLAVISFKCSGKHGFNFPFRRWLTVFQQRSTMVLSPSFDLRSPAECIVDQSGVNAEAIKEREELMASLSTGVASATLRLLVAMCALLTQADHRILGPLLWSRFLDDDDPHVITPVRASRCDICSFNPAMCHAGLLSRDPLSGKIARRRYQAY
jgi:hypothetical protein